MVVSILPSVSSNKLISQEQWCKLYAKDRYCGAVQADLPAGRKGHEELQLQFPKLHFSRM